MTEAILRARGYDGAGVRAHMRAEDAFLTSIRPVPPSRPVHARPRRATAVIPVCVSDAVMWSGRGRGHVPMGGRVFRIAPGIRCVVVSRCLWSRLLVV